MGCRTVILSAPEPMRQAAAAGILASAIALTLLIMFAGVTSITSQANALQEKRQHLGRLQSVLALKPVLESVDQGSGMEDDRPEFLRGSSDAVIQAELQAWLSMMAANHNVEVMSVGNAPLLEQDGMRFAGLRANISGNNQGIQSLIFEIEAAKPYLIIRQAQLHSTVSSQQAPRPGQEELVLQVQFYGALPPPGEAGTDRMGAVR